MPAGLSDEDVAALKAAGINAAYLSPTTIAQVRAQFQENGSLQLYKLLNAKVLHPMMTAAIAADKEDCLGRGAVPDHHAGVTAPWVLTGPPHMQRMMVLADKDAVNAAVSDTAAAAGDAEKRREKSLLAAARVLAEVRDKLVCSPSFARLVSLITQHELTGQRVTARRFRPGLDYTVAMMPDDKPRIDVSICFVNDQSDEDKEMWDSGDVGGFECYIKAEAEDNPEVVAVYDAKADGEESELANISAVCNTLSLVMRPRDQMRFVKYVSNRAPGSRWDVFCEYRLGDASGDAAAE